MPRPRSLTQHQIATAALAVIDRAGLEALSMRTVAGELGMSTMALYRYVHDREEVERLVVDLVLSAIDTTPPAGGPWRRRVTTMVERLRAAVAAHPAVVPLALTHRHRSVHNLRWAEAVLGILADAGISGRERVVALRSLVSYVVGAIQLEHLGPLSGAGTDAMAELSPMEFPLLALTAREARPVRRDEEFSRGLEVVLRGLEPS